MDEIVAEFLVESYESLDRLDRDLLALERDPHSREVLASIFRTMHTIKGTCGFLGFAKLEMIAHAAESLLAGLRDGSLSITPQTAGVLLATGDVMRLILRQIEATGTDGEDDHDGLVEDLGRLRGAPPGVSPAVPPAPGAQPEPQPVRSGPDRSVGLRSAVTETTVRVDVNVLDRLMTLVGELVLARNQLAALASDRADPSLASATQSVDRITAELQEGVTKTRLQPIRTAWATLPRVARDLAVALDKRVRIETDGDDTELDRSIIEAIKDPLTHIVRNAVDHGIEGPEARVAAGKAEEGAVIVRAYHEGGQVTIEVADDGAGIDVNAVRTKAVELASVTPEQAKRMSEREALDLLFLPGLSTADEVTTVSGRGVGMDVVRTNIERIGGSIDLSSRRGEGTIFKIRIPLTLAIIPVLIVTSRDERFAIPQANLLELVGVVPGSIEILHEVPVYRLRDRLLPVVSLARELHLGGDDEESPAGRFLVVLQADDRRFGLLVDGLSDPSEIVVKPLGAQLHGLEVFAGATILGTGRVGLVVGRIIDIVEQPAELQPAGRPGVTGTMFVQGRITEILDLPGLLEMREERRRLDVSASAGAAS